jgi:hypothetical protein
VNSSRSHLDVFAISDQPPKQTLRNRTAANVAGADKENVFHDSYRARETHKQRRVEADQVNQARSGEHSSWELWKLEPNPEAVSQGFSFSRQSGHETIAMPVFEKYCEKLFQRVERPLNDH